MAEKILTAYFSASGVTRSAAKKLAAAVGSDLYEIKPAIPYTQQDLDWTDSRSRSTKEMKGEAPHPQLSDKAADIQKYQTIILGFPIWWYIAPTIINSFLESYDFSGKKIILFATSGGSGFGKTAEKLKDSVADNAEIIIGKILNGNPSDEELKEWTKELV